MYQPEDGSVVDLYLTEHAEVQIHNRFPGIRLKSSFKMLVAYNESPIAQPMWSFPIHGGCLLGTWAKSKVGSYIKAIFIVETALYDWQYKRSQFQKTKFVEVEVRRINSKIKIKLEKGLVCKKESVTAMMAVSNMVLGIHQQNWQKTLFVQTT